MSVAFSFNIEDHASSVIDKALLKLAPSSINPMVGDAVARLVVDHLAKKDGEGNKQGFPSQHFYADAARSVSHAADETGATVTIAKQGVLQRYKGGDIKPVNFKYLTIAAIAEAYGKRARDFKNLVPLVRYYNGERRAIALVEASYSNVKFGREKKDGSRTVTNTSDTIGTVYFWLVKHVHQEPDPSVIPTEAEMAEAALQAIRDQIDTITGA